MIIQVWFWHQNWAIWQFYVLIDLDCVLSCILFCLICGCEDWLVTDAKKNNNRPAFQPLHTSIRRRERDRGREAWTRFRHLLSPEFTICHVKLQTCQSQDFLQFYFQGQMVRRGDPTAGEHFPSPTTLPLKKSQRGGGSKDRIIVPFSQLHPLTHSEPGLQLAF